MIIAIAAIGLIPAVSIATVGVLYLTGAVNIVAYKPNYYQVIFANEGEVIFEHVYRRGDKLDKIPDPYKPSDDTYVYSFDGWDLTGNYIRDVLPNRVYGPIYANALYSKVRMKK